jgi:prepilin-type N-terminal cleavage/methylation domain-containing protein
MARRSRRGFTLIELAIVVVIVGILSVIAVVGYRRYMLHSKITEAQTMISAIRIAQEEHRAEKGIYANVGTNYCPAGAGVGNVKVGWHPACSGGTSTWENLPVHADGPVLFTYATVASAAGDTATSAITAPTDANWVDFSSAVARPYYIVMAKCNLDLDSSTAPTQLVGSSFTNQIFSRNNGN